MASELELKLAATPEKINKIRELDFPGAESQSPWQTQRLNNTYFDTENFKLREMAIGMRIRQIGDKYIQTVKSSGKAIGGLHQRNEDEIELQSNELDITQITEPYLQILIEEANEEDGEFKPSFNTNFDRTSCLLTFSDSTKIEVSLDIGQITADEHSVEICEVELELYEGSAEYLFAIGRYLIKELDLTLYNASKARRGYSLCEKLPPDYYRMQVTELSQGIESELAFEQICFSALKHWQYYELFLNKENAHSAVLEMYRALIYLHHMYMVFGGLIPRQATLDLRNNWGWLAEAMRPIVDAAKHKRYLMRYLKQKADWDLVEEQQKKIESEVKQAIEEFKSLLATPRYNLMMLNMSQWLYFKEWRDFIPEKEQDNLKTPIIDFARKQLEHMLKELKRDLGPKVELSPREYFKLIAKIRRALDTGLFFGGLFDSQKRLAYRKPWVDILDGIRELQMNDYIFELQLETHQKDEVEEWLNIRNQPILEAVAQTRKAAFKSNPYWN
ncbi:CYTH and CHAD domain-containing protein [Aliikangiella coralliicola]|uniref:CYTH domain-containing protein n=1 Tax=Aliikangiella coralliicola TaxID=2592383 RepID=A0A545UE13_9GAMM|nr:CYTH and CHAD domain-containing protein [Aliikangiella coralliicola]TQV87688.1 CYTH domain-containing protein [Aliikangiella coralliicola]